MKVWNNLMAVFLLLTLSLSCAGYEQPGVPALIKSGVILQDSQESRYSWGTWDVTINSVNGEITILPDRNADFCLNALKFLQTPSAPIDLLTIVLASGTDLPSGKVVADVTLKHPFPGSKYCGFDVMGIIIDDYPSVSLTSDPSIILSMPPETLLRNPDGWTRWWNPSEFTTYEKIFGYTEGHGAKGEFTASHTLNAFKYYSDDIGATDPFEPDINSRGFFSAFSPGVNTRRYELQFPLNPGPVIHFKYSVSANYGPLLPLAMPPYSPGDFPISANMGEVFRLEYVDNGSTAYYENGMSSGGDLIFYLEVHDWQFDGDPSHINDQVAQISFESPTLFDGTIDVYLPEGTTDISDHTLMKFPVYISDVHPDGVENQYLIVSVNSSNPSSYIPPVPGFAFPDGKLASYGIFEVPISQAGQLWKIEEIDNGEFSNNRALDIDSSGDLRICYKSLPDNKLKYAIHGSGGWNYITSDIALSLMESMMLDSSDNPHVLFGSNDATISGTYYAKYNGTSWEVENIVLGWSGTQSDLVIDSLDRPNLAVHGGTSLPGQGTWWMRKDDDGWQQYHTNSETHAVGQSIDVTIDNLPWLACNHNYSPQALIIDHFDAVQWFSEFVTQPAYLPCIRVSPYGSIGVSFNNADGATGGGDVLYGTFPWTGWEFEVVEDFGTTRMPCLAYDQTSLPHLSYTANTIGAVGQMTMLRYAHFDGVEWDILMVGEFEQLGIASSIQILPDGKPVIAFNDQANGKVMIAWGV